MEWAERLLFGNSARKYEVKRVVVHNVNGAFTGRLSMNRRNACTFGVESRTRTTMSWRNGRSFDAFVRFLKSTTSSFDRDV